jgi:hypothetical protein
MQYKKRTTHWGEGGRMMIMIHFQFVGMKIQRNLLFSLEVVIPIPSELSFRLQFSEDE